MYGDTLQTHSTKDLENNVENFPIEQMGFKSAPLAFRCLYTKTMLWSRNKTASILWVGSKYINLASTSPKGLSLDRWDDFWSCFRKIGFWTIFTQPLEVLFEVSVVPLLLLISIISFSLLCYASGVMKEP